jgi:hypothetical protein
MENVVNKYVLNQPMKVKDQTGMSPIVHGRFLINAFLGGTFPLDKA